VDRSSFIVEKSGPIAVVTINRPEKLNAFTLSYLFDFRGWLTT